MRVQRSETARKLNRTRGPTVRWPAGRESSTHPESKLSSLDGSDISSGSCRRVCKVAEAMPETEGVADRSEG